jgi:hypothetical protein
MHTEETPEQTAARLGNLLMLEWVIEHNRKHAEAAAYYTARIAEALDAMSPPASDEERAKAWALHDAALAYVKSQYPA